MFKDKVLGQKLLVLVVLILAAALSIGYLGPVTSTAANRAEELSTLDSQKTDAMMLTASLTTASFLISALPDDMGSSLADELDSLSGILMLIVCVLYLEKFLLTTTGFVSFTLLIPLVCILFGFNLFRPQEALRSWAVKLLLFALMLFLMVPTSVKLTDMINETFEESIELSKAEVSRLSAELSEDNAEESNAFKKFINGVTDGVQVLFATAKNMLSALIDAVSLLLITACIIPALTILIFLWGFRKLFGVQINVSLSPKSLSLRQNAKRLQEKGKRKLEQTENLEQPE